MNIKGKHIRVKRWVHTPRCVVSVELDAVIPDDDPSEPCFGPDAVAFFDQVRQRAEAGDLDWLKTVGQVFVPAEVPQE